MPWLPQSWDALEIGDVIGQGAFGTVYRGFDCELQREIAIRSPTSIAPPRTTPSVRCSEEARMLAKIRHPNVVAVFGARRVMMRSR